MKTIPTTYCLEIHQLHESYSSQASLEHATRLDLHESASPFGSFHVGETVTDGPSLRYIGRIQHIHHYLGVAGGDEYRHTIQLYLFAED